MGDPAYGGRRRQVAGDAAPLNTLLHGFARQALHAQRLTLAHPISGRDLSFEAPLPADFRDGLDRLAFFPLGNGDGIIGLGFRRFRAAVIERRKRLGNHFDEAVPPDDVQRAAAEQH